MNLKSGDFWGDLNLKTIRTPKSILEEQGNLISKKTGDVLRGRVFADEERSLHFTLYIVAPQLNSYRCGIVTIIPSTTVYPVSVYNVLESQWPYAKEIKCTNEEEYISALQSVLGSEKIRKVIEGLYAQSMT